MGTMVPAKKGSAYSFYISLVSQANPLVMQANPTLAAGDVKVAIDDGAPANLTDLPVVDADFTKRVKVTLTASEMNGDSISILFSDASGDEWCDLAVNIQTVAAQIDDIKAETASILTDTAEIGAAGAGLTALAQAAVCTEARLSELAAANLPADIDTIKGSVDDIGVAGAGLTALGDARLANLDAAVSTRSTLTAQQVWEYATRTLSSFGTLVADVATAVWGAVTRTLTACVKGTEIDAIKGKTDNLPTDPADQSAVEAAITAATAALALEANVQGHAADALAAYDPPTRAEATTDKQAILDALGALNDITVGELLAGNLADDQVFAAGTLGDRLRKLFWVLCNRLAITDATGALIAYKDDGTTPGATGTVEDDGTTTERSIPTWP